MAIATDSTGQPRSYESIAILRDLLWLVVGIVAMFGGTAAGVTVYWWLNHDGSHTLALAGGIVAGLAIALVAAAPYLVFIAALRLLTDIGVNLRRGNPPPVN